MLVCCVGGVGGGAVQGIALSPDFLLGQNNRGSHLWMSGPQEVLGRSCSPRSPQHKCRASLKVCGEFLCSSARAGEMGQGAISRNLPRVSPEHRGDVAQAQVTC